MEEDVIIRKAKIKEAKEIGRLWKSFTCEHDANVVRRNRKFAAYVAKITGSQSKFVKYIERCIRSRNALVNVAVDDRKIVAYSLVRVDKNIPIFKIQMIGHFADLYVQKNYRRRGISSRFRDLGIAWLKSKNIKHVSIRVYLANDYARSIYKKWGFTDLHVDMRMKI